MSKYFYAIFCILFVLFAFAMHRDNARAVSLTFNDYTTGSVINSTELNTNILGRMETAVSQLNTQFVNYTGADRVQYTFFNNYTGQNFINNNKFKTYTGQNFINNNTFKTYTGQNFISGATFSAYTGQNFISGNTFKTYTGQNFINNNTYTNYTSEVRTYMDNHKFYQYTDASYATYSSVNATIPLDDTVPEITQGRQISSLSITPTKIGSDIRISFDGLVFAPTINKHVIIALYANNTCIDVSVKDSTAANQYMTFSFEGDYTTNSLTAVPIQSRIGTSDGSIVYLNGNASARVFGGAIAAHTAVVEIEK